MAEGKNFKKCPRHTLNVTRLEITCFRFTFVVRLYVKSASCYDENRSGVPLRRYSAAILIVKGPYSLPVLA